MADDDSGFSPGSRSLARKSMNQMNIFGFALEEQRIRPDCNFRALFHIKSIVRRVGVAEI